MSVQMIELEEVQMDELSDEVLETTVAGGGYSGGYGNSFYHQPLCSC